jgi:hypothetical protein
MPALNAVIGSHASWRATTRYRETCEGLRSTRDVQAIVTVRASRPGPLHPLDGRLPVTGRYRGRGQHGGAPLDAAFAHLIAVDRRGDLPNYEVPLVRTR